MAWSTPRYSKTKVDAAGRAIAARPYEWLAQPEPIQDEEALDVVNNWRSSHGYPLYVIRKRLEARAKKISSQAIVAQRLKRLASIERKLRESSYRNMTLTQIQDIGGCRAILPTIGDALKLVEQFTRSSRMRSILLRSPNDYISHPKEDGYRGVHLVFKFQAESERFEMFNGHRIEIQIRSALQHSWATAAEMLLTFADVPIRVPIGPYNALPRHPEVIDSWRRFFKLMASAIALRENMPIVPHTPADDRTLVSELRQLAERLNAAQVLSSWSKLIGWHQLSNSRLPGTMPDLANASQFVLELKPSDRSLGIFGFTDSQTEEAFKTYMSLEINHRSIPSTNVVLVSVASIEELKNAYPNYYGDTDVFVNVLNEAIR